MRTKIGVASGHGSSVSRRWASAAAPSAARCAVEDRERAVALALVLEDDAAVRRDGCGDQGVVAHQGRVHRDRCPLP